MAWKHHPSRARQALIHRKAKSPTHRAKHGTPGRPKPVIHHAAPAQKKH